MRNIIIGIFLSGALINSGAIFGIDNLLSERGIDMIIPEKKVRNEDRYKNSSTAQSCIKVILLDHKTGDTVNAIFGNEEFARLIAKKYGLLIDKKGRLKDQKAYIQFLNKEYLEYMLKNGDKPIDIDMDIEKLKKSSKYIFDRPVTFEQLNINSEQELLEKYFDFDYIKGKGTLKVEYYEKYTRNPSFIALLIDLGYYVTWGDIAPVLTISTTASYP